MLITLRKLTAILLSVPLLAQQNQSQPAQPLSIPLQVSEGTPLRLFITHHVRFRQGAPVTAQLIDPVWSFDRIVVPAGAIVQGEISSLIPVERMKRVNAVLGGDLTPLKQAYVKFNSFKLPDGRVMPIVSEPALGLPTTYVPSHSNKAGTVDPPHSLFQKLQRQLQAQITSRRDSFLDSVRGQNKKEWVEEYLLGKLPVHPQWYHARTRFDAVLTQPISFGAAQVPLDSLKEVGIIPPSEILANVRLLSSLTSETAKPGDPVSGVLVQPVFSANQKLVLPEGSKFTGKITLAQHARLLHRGGKMRFVFEKVDVPALEEAQMAEKIRTVQADLSKVEADPNTVKVDAEGTAKATESKTRLIRPVIAGLIAAQSGDDDAGRGRGITTRSNNANGNLPGRLLGGFSGFGLLGTAASFGPRAIGMAFGYYGFAWSIYSNLVARGTEVRFDRNTAMQIKLGTRSPSR